MGRHNQSDITTMLDTGVAIIEMFVSDNRENFSSQQTRFIVQKLPNRNSFEALNRYT